MALLNIKGLDKSTLEKQLACGHYITKLNLLFVVVVVFKDRTKKKLKKRYTTNTTSTTFTKADDQVNGNSVKKLNLGQT